MRQRKSPLCWNHANIVGIADSADALSAATDLSPGVIDALELRLDALQTGDFSGTGDAQTDFDLLLVSLPIVSIIATARDPAEGGSGNHPPQNRMAMLTEAAAFSDAIDIELANAGAFGSVISTARTGGCQVILSHHDFTAPITLERAKLLAQAAADHGADLFKLAVTPRKASDLCPLLALPESAQIPIAVMGMGPFGKISRLACAAAGSALNYGWLVAPNVPGQWSAPELALRFAELGISPA